MKVAHQGARPDVDFERTAAAMALARGAGVPVAATLAADACYRAGPWQYLVHSYLDGIPWHQARPQLGTDDVDSAHRQLAQTLRQPKSPDMFEGGLAEGWDSPKADKKPYLFGGAAEELGEFIEKARRLPPDGRKKARKGPPPRPALGGGARPSSGPHL